MAGPDYGFFFFIDGEPHLGVGRDPTINVRHISPDFFRAMEIPVRRGRSFTERDTAQSVPVVIINEAAVRRYFQKRDPIGWHLADSRDGIMREIVGIVGDVRFNGPDRCCPPELYLPYPQRTSPTMTLVVSSTVSTDAVAGAIRQSVRKLDPDQAVAEIRPMERVVAARTAQQQFTSSLLGTFASVATALAAIGLYGVVAVFVSQRRHEFGVRIALGAQRRDVLRLVMRHGGGMIFIGTAAGLIGAMAVSRLLQSLLYGVTATEPLSYIIGAAVLLLTGLVACYVPARRATRVDPAQTLRAE
jgi:putative ABC transport system permease protein